jgi:hypothetical protein
MYHLFLEMAFLDVWTYGWNRWMLLYLFELLLLVSVTLVMNVIINFDNCLSFIFILFQF